MTYKIIYTQKALADLDAVASYIKLKLCNISASERIVENFFGEGDSLVTFPTRYPLCHDEVLHMWEIRFVPVKITFCFISCVKMSKKFMFFAFCIANVIGKRFCLTM